MLVVRYFVLTINNSFYSTLCIYNVAIYTCPSKKNCFHLYFILHWRRRRSRRDLTLIRSVHEMWPFGDLICLIICLWRRVYKLHSLFEHAFYFDINTNEVRHSSMSFVWSFNGHNIHMRFTIYYVFVRSFGGFIVLDFEADYFLGAQSSWLKDVPPIRKT